MENKIITIQISNYLTRELAEKIALTHYGRNDIAWVNRITDQVFDDKRESDCFHVIAVDQADNVIGRLYCIRNIYDAALWYYGDLFVAKDYRRNGIAETMAKTAINYLSDIGASVLRVYVSSDNHPSLSLQRKLGFIAKEREPFNNLLFDDSDVMFEKDISPKYTFLKIDANYLHPVLCFYMENMHEFCTERLVPDDLKKILSDKEKENYLICKGCIPLGWLCAQQKGTDLLIEYFIVDNKHRHDGIGTSMLTYAITLAQQKKASGILVSTIDKNLPANRMAIKNGFIKIKSEQIESDSWEPSVKYTYFKRFML